MYYKIKIISHTCSKRQSYKPPYYSYLLTYFFNITFSIWIIRWTKFIGICYFSNFYIYLNKITSFSSSICLNLKLFNNLDFISSNLFDFLSKVITILALSLETLLISFIALFILLKLWIEVTAKIISKDLSLNGRY